MRRLLIIPGLIVLSVAKPDMYKEKEHIKYLRRSTDEGYYGAQRGNMGGDYEKAPNMDSLEDRLEESQQTEEIWQNPKPQDKSIHLSTINGQLENEQNYYWDKFNYNYKLSSHDERINPYTGNRMYSMHIVHSQQPNHYHRTGNSMISMHEDGLQQPKQIHYNRNEEQHKLNNNGRLQSLWDKIDQAEKQNDNKPIYEQFPQAQHSTLININNSPTQTLNITDKRDSKINKDDDFGRGDIGVQDENTDYTASNEDNFTTSTNQHKIPEEIESSSLVTGVIQNTQKQNKTNNDFYKMEEKNKNVLVPEEFIDMDQQSEDFGQNFGSESDHLYNLHSQAQDLTKLLHKLTDQTVLIDQYGGSNKQLNKEIEALSLINSSEKPKNNINTDDLKLRQEHKYFDQPFENFDQQSEDIGQTTLDLGQQTEDFGQNFQISQSESEHFYESNSQTQDFNNFSHKNQGDLNEQKNTNKSVSNKEHNKTPQELEALSLNINSGKPKNNINAGNLEIRQEHKYLEQPFENFDQQSEDIGQTTLDLGQQTEDFYKSNSQTQDFNNFSHINQGDLNDQKNTNKSVSNKEHNKTPQELEALSLNINSGKPKNNINAGNLEIRQEHKYLEQPFENFDQQSEDIGQTTLDLGQQTEDFYKSNSQTQDFNNFSHINQGDLNDQKNTNKSVSNKEHNKTPQELEALSLTINSENPKNKIIVGDLEIRQEHKYLDPPLENFDQQSEDIGQTTIDLGQQTEDFGQNFQISRSESDHFYKSNSQTQDFNNFSHKNQGDLNDQKNTNKSVSNKEHNKTPQELEALSLNINSGKPNNNINAGNLEIRQEHKYLEPPFENVDQQSEDIGQTTLDLGQQTEDFGQNFQISKSESEHFYKSNSQTQDFNNFFHKNQGDLNDQKNTNKSVSNKEYNKTQQEIEALILNNNSQQPKTNLNNDDLKFRQEHKYLEQPFENVDQQNEDLGQTSLNLDQQSENFRQNFQISIPETGDIYQQQEQSGDLVNFKDVTAQRDQSDDVYNKRYSLSSHNNFESSPKRNMELFQQNVLKQDPILASEPYNQTGQTEKPGFWKSVGNKFSNAKEKVTSWFKSS